jgi:hypothetical protein
MSSMAHHNGVVINFECDYVFESHDPPPPPNEDDGVAGGANYTPCLVNSMTHLYFSKYILFQNCVSPLW